MADFKIVKVKLNGKQHDIKVKKDLAWGEFIELVKMFDFNQEEQNPANLIESLHVLLRVGTIDSPINVEDRTNLMKLPAGEITRLIGEIRKILPLEQYLKNLGMEPEEVEEQILGKKKA